MDIKQQFTNGLSPAMMNNLTVSTSPDAARRLSFTSPLLSPDGHHVRPPLSRAHTNDASRQLKRFNTQDIKVLLLENVNESGQSILKDQGYQVETLKTAMNEDDLIEKLK